MYEHESMKEILEPRRCGAKTRSGSPCAKYPIAGKRRCRNHGGPGDVLSLDPQLLQRNFQINTMALLHLIQAFGPVMIEAGQGAILATGNTAAYRGRTNFASFAPTKAAQRILLESAAELSPYNGN